MEAVAETFDSATAAYWSSSSCWLARPDRLVAFGLTQVPGLAHADAAGRSASYARALVASSWLGRRPPSSTTAPGSVVADADPEATS